MVEGAQRQGHGCSKQRFKPLPRTVAERRTLRDFAAFRSTVNGTELQILKGEFHRHTELSGDGGGDSSLEDMWRYAIDAAAMDWMGSSDHSSTHISYCMVYAEGRTRTDILNAMKKRHTYAATDTIIAEVRARAGGREWMMGDEFTTAENPSFSVKLVGTKPFAEIVIIKDDEIVHTSTSGTKEAAFDWTDPSPRAGETSYYYVRGKQTDDELVWASPMWIRYAPR